MEARFQGELEAVRSQYPSEVVRVTDEPLIVHWEDGIQMLRDAGHEVRVLFDAAAPWVGLGRKACLDGDLKMLPQQALSEISIDR